MCIQTYTNTYRHMYMCTWREKEIDFDGFEVLN